MSQRNTLFIGLVLLALLLTACGAPQNAPVTPTVTPYVPAMNLAEAQQIARQSACAQAGTLQDTGVYNPNSNTWWIDLAADKPDCNPACVVDVNTKTAEVNWRCTGAVMPDATQPPAANMANPASENCVNQGGTVSIQKGLTGGEYGLCVFPDGKQCEEWAMQRGECPAGGIAVAGRYTAQQPAADAIGRALELELLPDTTATLKTQFIGKGAPIVETGTWAQPDKTIVVTIGNAAAGKTTLPFQYENNALVLQGLGTEALTLKRTPAGNTHTAEFGGAKIAFDDQLAKSAQGENVAAIPVTDGPVMGGAAPAAIRFLFDGAKTGEYTDPGLTQVLIYKADEWANLDPSIAQEIANLKNLLATRPAVITDSIPVFPPIPAAQVFHAQTRYLDFQGGSGVGFVTHYAQDVSPVMAEGLFYTFQGLTNDGQYYVVVYSPVTTALLPAEFNLDGPAYDEFAKNYGTYLTDLVAQLDGLLPAAYTPDLTLIDGLVKSIEIGAAPMAGSAIQPLPAEVCSGLAQAMAQALDMVEVTQAEAPLTDFTTGASGTGCQATVTGTGEQFTGSSDVVNTLGSLLKDQGWAEDMMLGAGGPTGVALGYRKGDQLCMASAMWQPDASANCPKDQPIGACELKPEQQLYTVTLNCGVEAP